MQHVLGLDHVIILVRDLDDADAACDEPVGEARHGEASREAALPHVDGHQWL